MVIKLGAPAAAAPITSLFQARATANQTISVANTVTPVALNVEDFDDPGGHSETTQNTRFYVPAGEPSRVYRVCGALVWNTGDAVTAGTLMRQARILKNGNVSLALSTSSYPSPANFHSTIIVPTFVNLVGGDYVELMAYSALAGATLYGTVSSGSILTIERYR